MAIEALYVHIPFCHAKCAYCDFDSRALDGSALDAAAARYLDGLFRRIDALGDAGALQNVRTAYLGGGTPTVLGPRLPELVRHIRAWCAPEELTCEANPESFTEALAAGLAASGVTRISLGVQSFQDEELCAIGRLHDARSARAAVERAHEHGFDVSCDLMCGLPRQTGESWEETLREAIDAAPGHISVYPLAIEAGTPLARRIERGEECAPDEDFQAESMVRARDLLEAFGYARYEVASYAKPGKACQHNIAYWTGTSYLGVGRSAAGMLTAGEFCGLSALFGDTLAGGGAARVRFVQRDDAACSFDFEFLSEREAIAEDLMLAMRTTVGAPPELIERAQRVLGAARVQAGIRAATKSGLARLDAATGALVPTEDGWLLGNELFGIMWDLR